MPVICLSLLLAVIASAQVPCRVLSRNPESTVMTVTCSDFPPGMSATFVQPSPLQWAKLARLDTIADTLRSKK